MSTHAKFNTPLRTAEYHDFEISLCGFSQAGKTTLIRRLVERFSGDYSVGYLKSDSHSFAMDREGKDTHSIWQAGAGAVSIFDACHVAYIRRGEADFVQHKTGFEHCDFVLVEGRKASPLAKIVMLGGRGDILPMVESGEVSHVLAYAGPASEPPEGLDAPYFHRDDVAGIADFILGHFADKWSERPLNGLVLTGGLSKRMGEDKALLRFEGKTLVQRTLDLLGSVCPEVFVSARPGQRSLAEVAGAPILEDRFLGIGPLGGILSAMTARPGAAWLVVACDLPRLDHLTLRTLIAERSPMKVATAFAGEADGMPEPLCAIYEPRALTRIFEFLGLGYQCPRKMLMNSNVRMVGLPRDGALANMNSREDYRFAKNRIEEVVK